MAEGEIEVNGGNRRLRICGPDDGEVVTLTPGGRFSKDYGGVHELATRWPMVASAYSCGTVQTAADPTYSCTGLRIAYEAETLGLMLKKLGIEQVIASGGSGGARDSIVFTMMWPELV